jgi:hypothetical protein
MLLCGIKIIVLIAFAEELLRNRQVVPDRKPDNFLECKAGEDFNHRHTLSIPRIKI